MANMATAEQAAGATLRYAEEVTPATEVASVGKFTTEETSYTCIYFDEKPDAATRSLLKSAGFRFQPQMNNAWFGETAKLPEQFLAGNSE